MTDARLVIPLSVLGCLYALPAAADAPFFSTGDPDGKIATASRPDAGGAFEIESADDFVLTHGDVDHERHVHRPPSSGDGGAGRHQVIVEMYRVFPKDSDVGRTRGPPTFSTGQVPTRVNSPSDVAFAERDAGSGLTFSISVLNTTFSVPNSIGPGGIHAAPDQTTGGDGAVRGEEVQFTVNFASPFVLPADHYFFVPQVQLNDGDFLWLSAPKPIVPPGASFPAGFADLQSWTRDEALDPDWLRVGTDIVGAGAFNAAFSLSGSPVPEPSTWAMVLLGFAGLGFAGYRHARKARPALA